MRESLKQLFQQEFGKMVAVISKLYGLENIGTAEDIVSETFLQAAESWGVKGLPANPAGWLYTVAKHKALYYFRRNAVFQKKVVPELRARSDPASHTEEMDFSHEHIRDSQLQMLFAVCDPAIASEAQIGLALRVLCGFGIDEIAEAFLTNKETINKRLFRAKEKLRTANIKMEMPEPEAVPGRLENVLRTIYLLFNEGYYSRSQDQILRKELCAEAMRLGLSLTEYPVTDRPQTNALVALMCFHASRFDARTGTPGDVALVLYDNQDESKWDQAMIGRGMHYLGLSAHGEHLTSYHLEARIAAWHCTKEDTREKWEDILRLYDRLLEVNYSPSAALNRVYALYKVSGKRVALEAAEKLRWENNHFYFLLLGDLYTGVDTAKALSNLQAAYDLAKTTAERQGIGEKIAALANNI
ncbi:MAG TPA: sigma-70 family RNA polymerase sigma factor [Puia sp.]|nr:sigma-70 family RNA polymerase sigma factor [Puia sp.]